MRACSCEQEYQLCIVLFPNQEPVGSQVALPAAIVLRREFVWTICGGQLAVGLKQSDGRLEQFHVVAAPAAAFRVLAERLSHSDFEHTSDA